MKAFDIYHSEREWARTMGDPLLDTIEAEDRDRAQEIANKRFCGWPYMTGVIAVERRETK